MQSTTIIIPTWDEAPNVGPLTGRLQQALSDWDCHVLFVDDSPSEDTADAVKQAASRYGFSQFRVSVLRRTGSDRWGGLAGAVTDGLRQADTPYAVVMDADLQHEPETVPRLLEAVSSGKDLAIGSRYCTGGSSVGLSSPVRHLVSKGSTYAAKAAFPLRLRHVSDPMTGFYALRLGAINMRDFDPVGFKILLETLVRHPKLQIVDIPIHFAGRGGGESKASLKNGVDYIRHLGRLRFSV